MEPILILVILVFIVIAWAIAQGIKKFAQQYPPVAPDLCPVSGVGGWLLLLICLFFFLPLLELATTYQIFQATESQYPVLLKFNDRYNTFKTLFWGTFLVTSGLSYYAGVNLVSGRNKKVVNRAAIILWVIGPLATLFAGVILPNFIFGQSEFDQEVFKGLGSALSGAIFWTTYLYRSKRVRATYGN